MIESLDRKFLFAFLFSLLLLFTISIISYTFINKQRESSYWVDHTKDVIIELNSLLTTINEAIRSQRGYVLSGNPTFLEPYLNSEATANQKLEKISELVENNPIQTQRLDTLKNLINVKFSQSKRMVEWYDNGQFHLINLFFNEDTAPNLLADISILANEMIMSEEKLLDERLSRYEMYGNLVRILIVIFSFTAIIVALVSFRIINKELREKKALQLKVAGARDYYLNILENFPFPVWRISNEGKFDYVNQRWRDFTGFDIENAQKYNEIFHPEDKNKVINKRQVITNSREKYSLTFRARRKDGEYRYIQETGMPFFDEKNNFEGFMGCLVDVTEEKEAIKKLQESYEELARAEEFLKELNNELENKVEDRTKEIRKILESLPQLVWTTDSEGNLTYYNESWVKFIEKDPEKALKWGWSELLHPDDYERTRQIWLECIQTLKDYKIEYRIKNKYGDYRWFLSRAVPILNKDGEIEKWFGTSTDIQDQKDQNLVLEKANKELIRINKDLDNFVYTASHDLKTPIVNLEGLVNLLKKKLIQNNPEIENVLDMFNQSLARLKNTIHDLSEIAKVQKEVVEDEDVIHLNSVIESILADYKDLIKEKKITFLLDLKIDSITFSIKNTRSILTNLISNAIKYSSPDREAKVTIHSQLENNFIKITIADTGLGISAQQQEKMFGMFKRFHTHVEGTGIGLYIVKRIMDNVGGKIEVESKLNVGTKFHLYFPTSKQYLNS
jgi:PAS domain S-box-containing protein